MNTNYEKCKLFIKDAVDHRKWLSFGYHYGFTTTYRNIPHYCDESSIQKLMDDLKLKTLSTSENYYDSSGILTINTGFYLSNTK
jgi:hypothetical protein